jgi:hypothetical protein
MASQTAAAAIRAMLEAALPLVAWRWENESADPPDPAAGVWCLVEFTSDVIDQESIGAGARTANRWRERGTVFAHVFAPSGTGTTAARTLGEQIADVFRASGTVSPGIVFEAISPGLGDADGPDGNWWRLPISIAFARDL